MANADNQSLRIKNAPFDLTRDQIAALRDTKNFGNGRSGVSDEDFAAIVHDAITDAEDFVDQYLATPRENAASFYDGGPMGSEVPGRSSIVMTEVHDVVNAMLPGLMRLFTGNEHVLEFEPQEQNDVEQAKQATDYVDFLFMRDNPGFDLIYQIAWDGLVKKCGVWKWWHEVKQQVWEETYDGLSREDVAKIAMDQDVEIIELTETKGGQPSAY